MPAPIPRRNPGMRLSLASPRTAAFPGLTAGRLPRRCFEASMAFTCVPACRLAELPTQPFPSKAFADLSPPPRLRLLLAGATLARRDFLPAENPAPFHGARQRSFSRSTGRRQHKRAWAASLSYQIGGLIFGPEAL